MPTTLTATKTKKGLNVSQSEMLSNFLKVIYSLDSKQKIDEKELRKMIYNAGVFLYRSYNNLERPDDFFHPGVNEGKREHALAGLMK